MYLDTQNRPQGERVDAVAPAKMKLSAAIRIGARLRPKCTGNFFKNGMSCALGAAVEARTGMTTADFPGNWSEFFRAPDAVLNRVLVRNDQGESRESIADWLESQGL